MSTDQDRATQEAEKRLKDEIDMHTELGEGDIPFTADVRLVLAALATCREEVRSRAIEEAARLVERWAYGNPSAGSIAWEIRQLDAARRVPGKPP